MSKKQVVPEAGAPAAAYIVENAAKESKEKGSLTSGQVKVATDKNAKRLMIGAVLLACFFDVLGTVLMIPAGPIMCQKAEGGPIQRAAEALALAAGDTTEYSYTDIKTTSYWNLAYATYGNPRAFDTTPKFSLASNLCLLYTSPSPRDS